MLPYRLFGGGTYGGQVAKGLQSAGRSRIRSRGFMAWLMAAVCFGYSCGTSVEEIILVEGRQPEIDRGAPSDSAGGAPSIWITDRTGKKWDIGHAVARYGFVPEKFAHGLGPGAIPPILEPLLLAPGEPGYPDRNQSFLVIGTVLEEDARAYPLQIMSQHEIVDEEIQGEYVAVAY